MQPEKKRERCKNYTEREKFTLLEITENYQHIIENKKTDNINVNMKTEAWDSIANEFNAIAETGIRTGVQLKLVYDNIKKKVKKDKADDKVELYKTGGGCYKSKVDSIGRKMLEINSQAIVEVANPYDSSVFFDIAEVTKENMSTSNCMKINANESNTTKVTVPEYIIDVPPLTESVSVDQPEEARHVAVSSKKRSKKCIVQSSSSEKEEIKLKILKTRLEKEIIEKDILLLKKRELELNIMEKEIQIKAMKNVI